MKIIFVDFDGVLNSLESHCAGFRDNRGLATLCPEHVARLNTIIDATGAVCVISSTWRRMHTQGQNIRFLVAAGFTGEVIDLHLIANKANIVRRAVEKEKLTLKNSVAVGDTEGDIPMLELVDTPICFNPNAKLYRIAKLNGWKVIVERKDVVYEIK